MTHSMSNYGRTTEQWRTLTEDVIKKAPPEIGQKLLPYLQRGQDVPEHREANVAESVIDTEEREWRDFVREWRDFVLGEQWSPEDLTLIKRLLRPVMTFNRIEQSEAKLDELVAKLKLGGDDLKQLLEGWTINSAELAKLEKLDDQVKQLHEAWIKPVESVTETEVRNWCDFIAAVDAFDDAELVEPVIEDEIMATIRNISRGE